GTFAMDMAYEPSVEVQRSTSVVGVYSQFDIGGSQASFVIDDDGKLFAQAANGCVLRAQMCIETDENGSCRVTNPLGENTWSNCPVEMRNPTTRAGMTLSGIQ